MTRKQYILHNNGVQNKMSKRRTRKQYILYNNSPPDKISKRKRSVSLPLLFISSCDGSFIAAEQLKESKPF